MDLLARRPGVENQYLTSLVVLSYYLYLNSIWKPFACRTVHRFIPHALRRLFVSMSQPLLNLNRWRDTKLKQPMSHRPSHCTSEASQVFYGILVDEQTVRTISFGWLTLRQMSSGMSDAWPPTPEPYLAIWLGITIQMHVQLDGYRRKYTTSQMTPQCGYTWMTYNIYKIVY